MPLSVCPVSLDVHSPLGISIAGSWPPPGRWIVGWTRYIRPTWADRNFDFHRWNFPRDRLVSTVRNLSGDGHRGQVYIYIYTLYILNVFIYRGMERRDRKLLPVVAAGMSEILIENLTTRANIRERNCRVSGLYDE